MSQFKGIHLTWDGTNYMGQKSKIFESDQHIEIDQIREFFNDEEWHSSIQKIKQEKFIGYDDKTYWRLVVGFK